MAGDRTFQDKLGAYEDWKEGVNQFRLNSNAIYEDLKDEVRIAKEDILTLKQEIVLLKEFNAQLLREIARLK
tara:strand:+ start:1696 stop:1911 length:216 start_codon:yes stop_codon:yes gene_type:complete